MSRIIVNNKNIEINKKPTQIISGAIHYFRILPELWHDRLQKAKMCGLNTIETYMCWNLHEAKEGEFDFNGILDFEKFIRITQELGLNVIIRPGPYICAEWENGGLPAWLMAKPELRLRCMNAPYIKALDGFMNVILPRLKSLQYDNGGPIIAMQIENEYGSFGHDKNYLRHLRNLYLAHGITIPLFTSDGPGDHMIQGGTLDDVSMTLNFGSNVKSAFEKGHKYRPDGPDFCMEYWNGWFDHWGGEHKTRDCDDAANTLEEMLSIGASVNIYMFHGGTNFNFWNGANYTDNKFKPTVTSYDYDAPLSECGDPTEKYFAYQKIIKKYNPDAEFGTPEPSLKKAYGTVKLIETALFFDNLDNLGQKHQSLTTEPMEHFGQDFGFINYRTRLDGPVSNQTLKLYDVHDRALIFLDGKYIATYYRNDDNNAFKIDIPEGGAQLDILVENMGRINFGYKVGKDFKGILGGIAICLQLQFDWSIWTLKMDDLSKLSFKPQLAQENQPAFFRGEFNINDTPCDTFLETPGVKGQVWINGFNIGRYWDIGPQKNLYVPAPLLKKGNNEIIILELHKLDCPNIVFTNKPNLG